MKKILLFGAVSCVMAFYACKKDDKIITVTNTVHDSIYASGQVNGETLSNGIKVGYGSKVADSALPAASTNANAPVLDSLYNPVYTVISGGYLTIAPANVSGNVAGYYVKIAGSKSYYKIDYTAAMGLRKAARAAAARTAGTVNQSGRGNGDGNIDSVIVIKLPATITGDSFYVKYAAYDTLKRVSNTITALVVVRPTVPSSLLDTLAGTWLYQDYRYYSLGEYSDWQANTTYTYNAWMYCNNGVLTQGYNGSTSYVMAYDSISSSQYITFGKSAASCSELDVEKHKTLSYSQSSCSNYVFVPGEVDSTLNNYAGISYDAQTKRLTLIYNTNSNVDVDYDTYYLSFTDKNTLILASSYSDEDGTNRVSYSRFIRK
jgi:hypothetical protein